MKLYKHKNNTDIAVRILSFFQPEGKDYARIKIEWWRIGKDNKPLWCMGIYQTLTDATIKGNTRDRQKYPISKWDNDWVNIITE